MMTDKILKLLSLVKNVRYKLIFSVWFSVVVIFPSVCLAFDVFSEYNPEEYQTYCNSEAFNEKYNNSGCWSCAVIKNLMKTLTETATKLSEQTIELGKLILLYGSAIWLAMYFLKSLSSAAAQDPLRVIDGMVTFIFKFTMAYIFINLGIGQVIEYIVNPLLELGINVGMKFTENVG